MGSLSAHAVYRPRRPRESPLFRLIERYLPCFERTYADRFERTFGEWRPVIGEVARRFLRCGDPHFGFARGTLLAAETIAQTICAPVPHRQLVFTIPKRLRVLCRDDRSLLGELARAAWQTTVEVYRQELKRGDFIPGMVAGIQTFGELVNFHPHIHAIATDGAFTPDGTFLCLPRIDNGRLFTTWQNKVFELFLARGKIDQETVDQMRSWPHSGFSVDDSVYLLPGDTAGLQRLAEYILRCPFSLARVVRLTDDGSVIYRAEKDHCRRFPGPAAADLRFGPKRNFQVFGALDFLAEVTPHIPNKGEHLVRYFGWYSHRQRGIREKLRPAGETKSYQPPIDRSALVAQKSAAEGPRPGSASTWAMLIKRVYEVDPLKCPCCGGQMKIVSFIERCQADVIERILRHCGLWEGPLRTNARVRAPPEGSRQVTAAPRDPQFLPDPEFLEFEYRLSQAEATRELQLVLDPDFL